MENQDFNKPMNIETSIENLELFCKISYEKNIKIFLIFGTLLGLYRDGNLIKGDNDIDLGIFQDQRQDLINLKENLKNMGFEIIRETKSIITIMRKDNQIDISVLHKINFPFIGWISGSFFFPKKSLVGFDEINYRNQKYLCPKNTEVILKHFYGEDWSKPSNKTAKTSVILFLFQKFMPKNLIRFFVNKFFGSN